MMKKNLRKKFLLLFCSCCLTLLSFAQSVRGTVTDETNAPLSGVSVRVVNASTGTTTNEKGEFVLQAQPRALLEFSYVGYNTVTRSADGDVITVILERKGDASMADVVVVGYSTQKRVNVSGAVSVIGRKSLENRPVANAVQALQGLSPGLIITRSSGQPGYEGWNVNVRGISSLNGTNNPLLIVDGVEYANLLLINPDDIESISVLKDASAAAIYGAKASNGVMLVTTKSGRSGKVTVNYTGMYQNKRPLRLPQTVPYHLSATIQNLANKNNGGAPSYTDAQIAMFKDPNINFVPDDPTNVFYYYEMDYIAMTIKNNVTATNHNLNVTGGTEKTRYFVGLGYNDNAGMFKVGPDGAQRYNARVNLTTKFNNIFSLDSRLSFSQNNVQAAAGQLEGDFGLLYNIYTLRPIAPIYVPGDESKYLSSVNTFATLKDGGYNRTTQNVLDGIFTLRADNLAKGLVLSANYSPHLEHSVQNIFNKTVPLYTFVKAAGTFQQNAWVNRSNAINKYRIMQTSHNANALAEYKVTTGEHNIGVLGGIQYQGYKFDRVNAGLTNLVNNTLPTLNYTTNATLPVTVVSDDLQENAWQSYFGRLNYDYKNKYFAEVTVRNDASSRLAADHRNQTFPAFSLAWRMSQESWFNHFKFINELKLRGSWGKLGNAQLGQLYQNNYLSIPTLVSGVYPFNNAASTYVYQRALPSEALGWETVTTTNLGVDFAFFNNHLRGSFDVYERVNDNMLIPVNLPAVLGVIPSTSNAAAMKTKGWELEMNWRDQFNQVNYNIGFNVSDNTNKITKYMGNVVYAEGLNPALPGMPINSIFGYRSLGYFQSPDEIAQSPKQFGTTNQGPGDLRYEDVNKDGLINGGTGSPANHGDLVYLGNTAPRYNFGVNLGLQWKGFDFSMFIQGTGKRSLILYPQQVIPYVNSWRYPLDNYIDNYWTENNRDAQFPRPIAGGGTNIRINSAFVQNGAYVRLKNVQVGYTVPAKVLNRAGIERLRVFFSGQDLVTFTKMWYKYFDPESPNNAAYTYPFFATAAVGINLTF